MLATEVLSREHRVIEKMLSALEVVARDGIKEIDRPRMVLDLVGFFRAFADKCHHAKEEDLFFPAMENNGFGHDSGPVAVMLEEHRQGRDLIGKIEQAARKMQKNEGPARQQLLFHAGEYTALLRAHIQKEDSCLFSMANQSIGEKDQTALLKSFEKLMSDSAYRKVYDDNIGLASDVAARLQLGEVEDGECACGCSAT